MGALDIFPGRSRCFGLWRARAYNGGLVAEAPVGSRGRAYGHGDRALGATPRRPP